MSILIEGTDLPKNGIIVLTIFDDGVVLKTSEYHGDYGLVYDRPLYGSPDEPCDIIQYSAKQVPPLEAPRKGHWLEMDACMTVCSECGSLGCGSDYCPGCGADMREEGS